VILVFIAIILLQMNENSLNNVAITIEHSLAEQHPQIDNQQCENSTQNQLNPQNVVNIIKQAKRTPMIPTPLYIFLFSSRSS